DYSFIAKEAGSYLIPAIVFSYFDPTDARYKTERSDSFRIQVIPASKQTGVLQKIEPDRPGTGTSFATNLSGKTLIAVLAFVLLFLGLFLWRKARKDERVAEITKHENLTKEVKPIDLDPFEAAKFALQQERSQDFFTEVNKALWLGLSDKTNIPSTELNKFNVAARLHSQGIDRSTIDQLQALLNECEIALYTPVHSTQDMKQTLATAESLLSYLRFSLT
ncbi:MAG: hypothetical protein WKF89_03340, partial [Chitinophagaceae bacterium]